MPELLVILWLPAAIAFMAVTYVLTLGAVHPGPRPVEERIDDR
jgi:hypothetical protein